MYLGSYGIDEYVAIPAVTHRFSSGAAYAPTAITYSIYEEGSTTGLDENVDMTPASPFDSITGLYYARRQLTAAAGFENNKTYVCVVKATVDSVSALDVHVFQIRPQQTGDSYAVVSHADYGNAKLVRSTTPANTLTVDASHLVAVPTTHKVDVDTIKTQTVTCAAGVTVLASVGTAATSTAQTGDSYAIVNSGTYGNSAIKTETASIKGKTDNLPAAPAATGDIPSAASIADAVWDEAISGHLGAGSTGNALNAAGSAGDPWSTALPGAYGAGTAGKIVGDNLNATVSSRSSHSAADVVTALGTGTSLTAVPWNAAWDAEVQSECTDALNAYDPPTNAEMEARTIAAASYATATDLATVDGIVDAIKAKTESLTFSVSGKVDANIKNVNNTALTGDGSATPWGPA